MARPKLVDRENIKVVRVTILVPVAVAADIRDAASAFFEGNASALLRAAFEDYKQSHGGRDDSTSNRASTGAN